MLIRCGPRWHPARWRRCTPTRAARHARNSVPGDRHGCDPGSQCRLLQRQVPAFSVEGASGLGRQMQGQDRRDRSSRPRLRAERRRRGVSVVDRTYTG
ncbi:MAG: hypothetical protein MZV49_18850 [Rhodopseudomonas palustris]|nr:hypothetical protein [Rhodopseudomonas palustris]